jgi:hypothetical protein
MARRTAHKGVVREIVPDARIILNASNLGVARARNQGVKVDSAKYILFLDFDTESIWARPVGLARLCLKSIHGTCAPLKLLIYRATRGSEREAGVASTRVLQRADQDDG